MHQELVVEKRWISEARFLHALNFCMLLPGPEAQQLAIYIGWLMHKTLGGLIAGLLFILPSFFILAGLGVVYMQYGDLPLMQNIFSGIKPVVNSGVILGLAAPSFHSGHGVVVRVHQRDSSASSNSNRK